MSRTKLFDETAVLNKAVDLFWCKGFNGTSAQDLVDNLGISRSSIYATYGDKRTLFLKALEQYQAITAKPLIQIIQSSGNIKETIVRMFEAAVKEALHDPLSRGCLIVNTTIELAPHDPEIARIISKNRLDIEKALRTGLKQAQEQGTISRKHTAQALATFLFNGLSGLRVLAKSGASKKDYDEITNISLSVLQD
jgi:TetR/AcrR family transcriptional repressor of nem operon